MAVYPPIFLVFFLINTVFAELLYLHVDPSPVNTTVGDPLTLHCNIGGYGISVSPTFVRWERRTSNTGEFHKITRNLDVVAGIDGISVRLIPGGFTYRYLLTLSNLETTDITASVFYDVNHSVIHETSLSQVSNEIKITRGCGFRKADVGSYKCVASGPEESHDVTSGTIRVVL